MTEGVIKTQGSELFTVDKLSASTASVLKFECPTGITGLGGAADQIESTCLDTRGDKEFEGGLGNPGQVAPDPVRPQRIARGHPVADRPERRRCRTDVGFQ